MFEVSFAPLEGDAGVKYQRPYIALVGIVINSTLCGMTCSEYLFQLRGKAISACLQRVRPTPIKSSQWLK
jgi:hypothetical protein